MSLLVGARLLVAEIQLTGGNTARLLEAKPIKLLENIPVLLGDLEIPLMGIIVWPWGKISPLIMMERLSFLMEKLHVNLQEMGSFLFMHQEMLELELHLNLIRH